jgi:hypothetical protein
MGISPNLFLWAQKREEQKKRKKKAYFLLLKIRRSLDSKAI